MSVNAPLTGGLQSPSPWLLRPVFQGAGLLSPMAALSFDPAADASFSVFSQYPAALLGERAPRFCRDMTAMFCVPEETPAEAKPQEVAPGRCGPSRYWRSGAAMGGRYLGRPERRPVRHAPPDRIPAL